jgi:SAM-dependent methyltransferase
MRVLTAEMQVPVAVGARTVFVHVRVHIQAARQRQPTDEQPEHDEETAADELAALLESDGNLPARKQHEPGAYREQQRVAHSKSHRKAERACIPGRPEGRRQRQRRNRHQVIGAKAVKKAEREHGPTYHGRDYSPLPQYIHGCIFMYVKKAGELYRLLGDQARLRLLRVLAGRHGRLNVTELTAVLGIAQSGVSRHLRLLKEAGLVLEERGGGFSYYRLSPALLDGGFGGLWPALQAQFAEAANAHAVRADEGRLQEVIRLRKENFEVHGTDRGQLVPGRSWAAWSRALGLLLPAAEVADIACGEGYLSVESAHWARHVVGIDRSIDVLKRAKELAHRRGVKNITWKRGDMEKLPLGSATVDVALLSQALHHAANPARAAAEAARILRPGGRVVVLDLRRHDQEWVRDRVGDRWLGFTDDQLDKFLTGAGLRDVTVRVGSRLPGDPFTVLIASGMKT